MYIYNGSGKHSHQFLYITYNDIYWCIQYQDANNLLLRATVAIVNKTKTKKNGKSSQLSSNIESNCSLSKLINIKYWIKNIVNFKKEKRLLGKSKSKEYYMYHGNRKLLLKHDFSVFFKYHRSYHKTKLIDL